MENAGRRNSKARNLGMEDRREMGWGNAAKLKGDFFEGFLRAVGHRNFDSSELIEED